MAGMALSMSLAMVVIATMWSQSLAQLCTPGTVNLTPCLNYLMGSSSAPPTMCCTQLAAIAQSQAMTCLCTAIGMGASQLGISFNQSQALTLPGACNIRLPPLNQCTAVSATPTSVAASPEGSLATVPPSTSSVPTDALAPTQSTPSVPSTPSGSGSKTVPTTGVPSSTTTNSAGLTSSLFFILFIAYTTAVSCY